MESSNYPIWYLLAIAIIGGLPATLTALTGLVYVILSRKENKVLTEKIEAKVDAVKTEVDGKTTQMIKAIETIAIAGSNNAPRQGRKTDPV